MSYVTEVPEGYEKCDWTEATHITTEDQCVNEIIDYPNNLHCFNVFQAWVKNGAMLLKKAPVEEGIDTANLIAQIVLRDPSVPYTVTYNLVYNLIDQVKKEMMSKMPLNDNDTLQKAPSKSEFDLEILNMVKDITECCNISNVARVNNRIIFLTQYRK